MAGVLSLTSTSTGTKYLLELPQFVNISKSTPPDIKESRGDREHQVGNPVPIVTV
jgi:hypothetical protein